MSPYPLTSQKLKRTLVARSANLYPSIAGTFDYQATISYVSQTHLFPLTCRKLIVQLTAESLFREFSESTRVGTREVQEFKQLMMDEDTKKVFAQARKSRAEKPDNIKPWRAIDHPGAFTRHT